MKSACTGQGGKNQRSIRLPVIQNPPVQESEIRKSKASRWRAVALISLNLLMVAHLIQWWVMGTTVSPIEPSETMYTLQRGAINAGLIFFSLAILATLIFGRFVCGWGCHILALQDFCAWLLKKFGLVPRPFRSRLLVYVPLIAALYMFVWPTVLHAFTKPAEQQLIPAFTNHLITNSFWDTFPTIAVAIPFLFICGFMTVYFLGSKGFCTYACPYGGFFSLADKVAPGKIRVTDACNQCGHCTATCTSNVLVHAEVKQFGMVVDPGCMKCMDCISVCPNDALYFGFGKPSVAVPKKNATKKNYSLTWPEETVAALVFLASFIAVWDVYQLVPMLMALGCAAITTFLALKTWKLLRANQMSFYRFDLKSAGKIQNAGFVFVSFAVLWVGLNAHSGWVHYHEFEGSRAFQRIQIPDELALAQADPDPWLGNIDRENIIAGRNHLQAATSLGLFANSDALPKLAWFTYLSGDAERSVQLLGKAASHQRGEAKALSLYYRGTILNRLGRYDQAQTSLDEALTERPDLILAREEKGESLWQLGRKQDAISIWRDAAQRNEELVLANSQLAGALASLGQFDEAIAREKQADQFTPNDPYYHWMLGLRLQNLGMNELAEKHFAQAIQLDPTFQQRRRSLSR
ncbi:MAG TPA: 4Fe-4S binding protein [Pyrinomonadaceae bacterium]|jgi:tetratricopeptide (TPR) repeat protein/ferredoxin|nr:4Fe-4S binding protein [Pyrinomonadaceae bacterium]